MNVKEKLVELLHKGVRCPGVIDNCNDCPYYSFEKACDEFGATVDLLIANGVTVQEWISTDKRMPTQEDAPTEYVLTAYKNENCYDVNISLWDIVVGYPDLYDYWMPLPMPQPPKGE